jgi:peptide/nickel transport system permease protein
MSTQVDPSTAPGVPTRKGRRPSPRLAQMKRTWYFLRRNTLAMIGLSVLICIALVAVYAATTPISWLVMENLCSTNYGPQNPGSGWANSPTHANGPFDPTNEEGCPYVCTYETVPPPNAAQYCNGDWYKIPYQQQSGATYPSAIPPTVNLQTLSPGPMPLGALATTLDSQTSFYNLYSGLLRGSDWSLIISISIVGVGALLGMLVGAVAGFWGGAIDDLLMRIVDIFLSIPVLLFVLVVVTVLSQTIHSVTLFGFELISQTWTPLFTMIMGFAITWWPFYARLVRGQVLVVREQKFVEAARASGAGKGRILLRHIIPNSVYPVFIQFSLDVGTIPLLIGGLVFLGFGPSLLPTLYFPEWGTISAISVVDMQTIETSFSLGFGVFPWWQLFFPGLALFLYAVSVNLLSDGLRDALDPRLRR